MNLFLYEWRRSLLLRFWLRIILPCAVLGCYTVLYYALPSGSNSPASNSWQVVLLHFPTGLAQFFLLLLVLITAVHSSVLEWQHQLVPQVLLRQSGALLLVRAACLTLYTLLGGLAAYLAMFATSSLICLGNVEFLVCQEALPWAVLPSIGYLIFYFLLIALVLSVWWFSRSVSLSYGVVVVLLLLNLILLVAGIVQSLFTFPASAHSLTIRQVFGYPQRYIPDFTSSMVTCLAVSLLLIPTFLLFSRRRDYHQ